MHEVIQLAQDGSEIVLCGDCGWEFGHIGRGNDGKTTPIFHAYVTPEQPITVVVRDAEEKTTDIGLGLGVLAMPDGLKLETLPVYPCSACGWEQSCEGGCHA